MTTNDLPTSSIQKALEIINCFNSKDSSLFLEEIILKTKVPKTTVFRILTQLEDYAYIKKVLVQGKSQYSLGYAFLEKGELVKSGLDIRELARNEMIHIRNETNLTVQLAIRDNSEAVYIEQFESWRPIRLYPTIGKRAPLYVAACPRVLLAYTESEEQNFLINNFEYKKFTKYTPVNPDLIKEILIEIRKNGYSISKGELFEGTIAVAVPIFNTITKEVIATISIVGIEGDFESELSKYINILKESSEKISDKIKSTT
ncbi:IclR family transcriptional regulator [Sporosarcina limicola]|uniref:DNA-binding IclR family transcriptional regulator n=1 Tax=Sporosarcina limicola TaxID=34101 RepID=A0A927R300_9BACL|nr:IclR family transcriptional regulator [Sporosarcina limicola]MBE1553218.1 DNA-binding IclR family transcriptional regulator [Sporosarcina limicola]